MEPQKSANTGKARANENYFGKLRKVYSFAKTYMETNTNHPYHNWDHAKDVGHSVLRLAKKEGEAAGIESEERFLLLTAALLHDVYFVVGGTHNEEISAKLAEMVLPKYGYKDYQTAIVADLIRATKLPTNPQNLLEQMICDADVDNIGRPDAFEKGKALQKELGIEDTGKWYKGQLAFFKSKIFYTPSARADRAQGLQKNIKYLEQVVSGYA